MYDHRQTKLLRQIELFSENTLLQVGVITLVVIVQAYLAYSDGFRQYRPFFQGIKIVRRSTFNVLGMNANSGVHKGILFGVLNRKPRAFKVAAHVYNIPHAVLMQAVQQPFSVRVELLCVVVGVGINIFKHFHQPFAE